MSRTTSPTPEGGLSVSGGDADHPHRERSHRRCRCCRRLPRLHAGLASPPKRPTSSRDGGVWPVHCVRDTWGAEFHPDLRVAGEVVRKGTGGEDGYSGFTRPRPRPAAIPATPFSSHFSATVASTPSSSPGLATDYCVRDTALDAADRGFATFVLIDAVRAVDLHPGDGARAHGGDAPRRRALRPGVAVTTEDRLRSWLASEHGIAEPPPPRPARTPTACSSRSSRPASSPASARRWNASNCSPTPIPSPPPVPPALNATPDGVARRELARRRLRPRSRTRRPPAA